MELTHKLTYVGPMIEMLNDPMVAMMVFEDKISKQVLRRVELSQKICDYLAKSEVGAASRQELADYYYAVTELLKDNDSKNILLYLPFKELKGAPKEFRKAYMSAWYELCNLSSARLNYRQGYDSDRDINDDGQYRRVVKCAHLLPWMIEAEYLNYAQVKAILAFTDETMILKRSLAETWRMISDKALLKKWQIQELMAQTAGLYPSEYLNSEYIAESRRKWLKERNVRVCLKTPYAKLEGPFSPNTEAFKDDLFDIFLQLGPYDVVLINGSLLKGYGTDKSNLDIWSWSELYDNPKSRSGSPCGTHFYFDSIWLGGCSGDELFEIAASELFPYFRALPGSEKRQQCLESLEGDLLQYRLLHKGIRYFYPDIGDSTMEYVEMDGDSAFYDDRYRRIATMLYAKYVFIPFFWN